MLLPVGALAVPAAVVHEAAAGAAHFRIGPPAVGAGAVVVAEGGLLLHRQAFGEEGLDLVFFQDSSSQEPSIILP